MYRVFRLDLAVLEGMLWDIFSGEKVGMTNCLERLLYVCVCFIFSEHIFYVQTTNCRMAYVSTLQIQISKSVNIF